MTSNYDITRDNTEIRFLNYDQEKMIRKFALPSDAEYLYVNFIGRKYRIHRTAGRIEYGTEGSFEQPVHAGFQEVLSICDVLCESKETLTLSGQFCTVNNLKGTVRSSGLGDSFIEGYARDLDGHEKELAAACEALGGVKQPVGDVAYLLHPFDFLPVILQFWRSDDEFPASMKLMWDENTLDYIKYETTYYVMEHLMVRLKEIMGLKKS